MKKITQAVLLVAFFFIFTNQSWAQVSGEYCVLEQHDKSKVVSRIDWLSIAKCSDSAMFAGSGLVSIQNNMTYAEAAALVDAMRVNMGATSSGEPDRFHMWCDHNYRVWKRTDGLSPPKAYTRADANPGPGFLLDTAGLCCEDAAALVFPVTMGINDCRTFELMSVPGTRATLQNGRWGSTGDQVTIRSNPPVNLLPINFATNPASPSNWAGTYRGPCTYEDPTPEFGFKQTSDVTMTVTKISPQTLRLLGEGSTEPLDLEITNDPFIAKGHLSKQLGTAASGGGTNMEYTAALHGNSLSLTMEAVSEGHIYVQGMQGQHKGKSSMNCTLQGMTTTLPPSPQ